MLCTSLHTQCCFWGAGAGSGYIKVDDLRRIVANLGHALSTRTVKELCGNVAGGGASAGRHRTERVYYLELCEFTDTV